MTHLTFFGNNIVDKKLFDPGSLKSGDDVYRLGIDRNGNRFIELITIRQIDIGKEFCAIRFCNTREYIFDHNAWIDHTTRGVLNMFYDKKYFRPGFYVCRTPAAIVASRLYPIETPEYTIIDIASHYKESDDEL